MTATELISNLEKSLSVAREGARGDAIHVWQDFRARVATSLPSCDEVLSGLRQLRQTKDWEFGEAWLVMAASAPSPLMVAPLCDILDLGDPHAPNENIVELLIDLKEPSSVPALARATSARYTFDPGLQIPIKAVEALCEIGTPEAAAAVEQVIASNTKGLSEEAKLLLEDD